MVGSGIYICLLCCCGFIGWLSGWFTEDLAAHWVLLLGGVLALGHFLLWCFYLLRRTLFLLVDVLSCCWCLVSLILLAGCVGSPGPCCCLLLVAWCTFLAFFLFLFCLLGLLSALVAWESPLLCLLLGPLCVLLLLLLLLGLPPGILLLCFALVLLLLWLFLLRCFALVLLLLCSHFFFLVLSVSLVSAAGLLCDSADLSAAGSSSLLPAARPPGLALLFACGSFLATFLFVFLSRGALVCVLCSCVSSWHHSAHTGLPVALASMSASTDAPAAGSSSRVPAASFPGALLLCWVFPLCSSG